MNAFNRSSLAIKKVINAQQPNDAKHDNMTRINIKITYKKEGYYITNNCKNK